jgi:hypothetical protein
MTEYLQPLTQTSKIVAAWQRFSGKCYLQVIYFDYGFSFPTPNRMHRHRRVETVRSMRAVKHVSAAGILHVLRELEGPGRGA